MIYVSGLINFFEKSFFCFPAESSIELGLITKLSELVKDIEKCLTNVLFCSISWSHLLFCNGEDLYICGAFNGCSGCLVKLNVPDGSKVIQGCCSNRHCHLVTEKGDYWLYVIKTGEWKNLNQLLCTEKHLKNSSDEFSVSKLLVHKVSCSDSITIVVSESGVYAVPVLLNFPSIKVLDVSCGKEHTLLLTEHFTVFSWGCGSRGQLGHGELETEEQPRELNTLSGLKVTTIAAGGWHSCCITEHGDLYSWGWNCSGQLGFLGGEVQQNCKKESAAKYVVSVLGEPRPVDLLNEQSIARQVACGSQHTIVVLEDNSLLGCGWNKYGQLMMEGLPEKVFGFTKLTVPFNFSNRVFRLVCGPWISALIC